MIKGYWWQGMRQPLAGPGGILWIEGAGLGRRGDAVWWGLRMIDRVLYLSNDLWGADLSDIVLNREETAPIRISHTERATVVGPPLTILPQWKAPVGWIAVYRDPNEPYLGVTTAEPGDCLNVTYDESRIVGSPPVRAYWGVHKLTVLEQFGGTVVVRIPDVPAGMACIFVEEEDSPAVWGPPLRIW